MKRIGEALTLCGLSILSMGVIAVIWNAALPDGFGQTFVAAYLMALLVGLVALVAGLVLEIVGEKS